MDEGGRGVPRHPVRLECLTAAVPRTGRVALAPGRADGASGRNRPRACRRGAVTASPLWTVQRRSRPAGARRLLVAAQLVRLALQVLEPAAHEERLLGVVVVLPLGQLLERLDGLLDRDERALHAGELGRRERVLGQEALD